MRQAVANSSIPQECFVKTTATAIMQCLQSSSSVTAPLLCITLQLLVNVTLEIIMIVLRKQSWGIPPLAIRVLLSAMQTMQYFLKTDFGESAESYGGTAMLPNSGLVQGSGASPPAIMALSSLIVNAYKRMGHSAQIYSSYFH
jgi:hypothetical protein